MDGISDKIAMKFKFNLDREVGKELITSKNFKILADVEGELEILFKEKMFFQEEYILLLEFGVFLSKWVSNVKSGANEDFVYETMDYSEGPILEFQKQEGGGWKFYSDWQKIVIDEEFSLEELLKVIEKFLIDLKVQLQKIYNISLEDYLTHCNI